MLRSGLAHSRQRFSHRRFKLERVSCLPRSPSSSIRPAAAFLQGAPDKQQRIRADLASGAQFFLLGVQMTGTFCVPEPSPR